MISKISEVTGINVRRELKYIHGYPKKKDTITRFNDIHKQKSKEKASDKLVATGTGAGVGVGSMLALKKGFPKATERFSKYVDALDAESTTKGVPGVGKGQKLNQMMPMRFVKKFSKFLKNRHTSRIAPLGAILGGAAGYRAVTKDNKDIRTSKRVVKQEQPLYNEEFAKQMIHNKAHYRSIATDTPTLISRKIKGTGTKVMQLLSKD